jgi:type IV secretion system protein VirD4
MDVGGTMIRLRITLGLLLTALLGLWGWTQYQAYHYGYHPRLGPAWWQVWGVRQFHGIYAPWQGLVWAWQWGSGWLRLWCLLGVLGTLLVCLLGWRISGKLARTNPPEMTGHGTGRWSVKKDIKEAGLL